ncbi:hypothetical protein E2C01_039393 [Portunus trituberculatus]|uniref:Uncharacterized protein n=1 Tax=Portunus trituberculatus TaxID=210409 RepID=A0A5B7FJJ9_PORTR|nr:hypothetical protein [Portunus trituberculatus]
MLKENRSSPPTLLVDDEPQAFISLGNTFTRAFISFKCVLGPRHPRQPAQCLISIQRERESSVKDNNDDDDDDDNDNDNDDDDDDDDNDDDDDDDDDGDEGAFRLRRSEIFFKGCRKEDCWVVL